MSKQVEKTAAAPEAAVAEQQQSPKTTTPNANGGGQARNLYMRVDTFDKDGKAIGFRVVDLFHYGTRNWLQNHLWWAMHNANCVEVNVATDEEVQQYLAESAAALQAKYAKDQPTAASIAA